MLAAQCLCFYDLHRSVNFLGLLWWRSYPNWKGLWNNINRSHLVWCTWNSGVIQSTLCVAHLTRSLVSKDLTYSRIIPYRQKGCQAGWQVGLSSTCEHTLRRNWKKKVQFYSLNPLVQLWITKLYWSHLKPHHIASIIPFLSQHSSQTECSVGVYLLPRIYLLPAVKASTHFKSLTVTEKESQTSALTLVFSAQRCTSGDFYSCDTIALLCSTCSWTDCQIQFPKRTSSTSQTQCHSSRINTRLHQWHTCLSEDQSS